MRNKKIWIPIVLFAAIALAVFIYISQRKKSGIEETAEITPTRGRIQAVISTTGTVLPKNRLEVKPPVNGRIDEILVKEGNIVKTGQSLALMSSTERAALLDVAREKGEKELNYWQQVYKPILLISPIDGEVIVATTQPGQTVTTSDAVIVLSDKLIVRAQVDETDIGRIKLGQKAVVYLDAYPDTKINAAVEHIYYESETINNVTIYKVDLLAESVPSFFRSGMNATVDFAVELKEDALLLPQEAIQRNKTETFVWVKEGNGKEPVKRDVALGISDANNVEIASGLSDQDIVVFKSKKYALPKEDEVKANPLLPFRRRRR